MSEVLLVKKLLTVSCLLDKRLNITFFLRAFLAVSLNTVVKWKKRIMFWDKIGLRCTEALYKPKGRGNALTYQSVLLLSRGSCCMFNSFPWMRVECTSLQESLHAWCHFTQLIWSSLGQVQVDFTVCICLFSSLRDWIENSTIIVGGMLVYT